MGVTVVVWGWQWWSGGNSGGVGVAVGAKQVSMPTAWLCSLKKVHFANVSGMSMSQQ